MKKITAIAMLLVIFGGLYLALKPHVQDPHYYAAACVVLNDMGEPASPEDFTQKLREVIIKENSSYAVNKVVFDEASARGAIQRYQQLSEQERSRAHQGIEPCLTLLPPDADR